MLPLESSDELSDLTAELFEAPRYLGSQGIGDDTLRALTFDLSILNFRGLAMTGIPCSTGAQSVTFGFFAANLRDIEFRVSEPSHGMPVKVAPMSPIQWSGLNPLNPGAIILSADKVSFSR